LCVVFEYFSKFGNIAYKNTSRQYAIKMKCETICLYVRCKATFTDLRNLSTFSLHCLFYFTVHQCTKFFGPKVK